MEFWNVPATPGVGTGYAAGLLGKVLTNTTGSMAVTANGTTMVLTVLPGWAVVVRDAGGSTFDPRVLFAESDANDSSITITANATGSTRNDTVCLKIDQNTAPTSDGSNLVSFVAIAGASGGGLSNAPADGNLYLPLANVAVANGATSLAQGNVSDLRSSMPAAAAPAGTLAGGSPTPVTANQGTFTALTDLTGLAATVIVGAGRRIRVSCLAAFSSSVANDVAQLHIREGAADLQVVNVPLPVSAIGFVLNPFVILTPTAGSHTYKLSAQRQSGTGNITMNAGVGTPALILVEDIGV